MFSFLFLFTFVIFSLFLLIYYYSCFFRKITKEEFIHFPLKIFRLADNFSNIKDNKGSLVLNPAIKEVLQPEKNTNIEVISSYKDANMLFFETLNDVDNTMEKLEKRKLWPPNITFINNIYGIDLLVSKSSLAEFISPSYIIPETYILDNEENMKMLEKNFSSDEQYILKKDIQRQQGFFISSSLSEIIKQKEQDEDYVVCQKMLRHPFLIKNHKINLRIYLFILYPQNKWCIFNNGFIYYTPLPYKENSYEKDRIITSGYVDRSMYKNKPMTLHELQKYMGVNNFGQMFTNIKHAIEIVKTKYTSTFQKLNNPYPGTKFALCGCDFAPDENLNVKLMEINKGPDINYKDERDKNVKYNLVKSMFAYLGILDTKHSFIEI